MDMDTASSIAVLGAHEIPFRAARLSFVVLGDVIEPGGRGPLSILELWMSEGLSIANVWKGGWVAQLSAGLTVAGIMPSNLS